MKQLAMNLPQRGGRRKGAGRKPNGPQAGVDHVRRARVRKGPVHVNWKMRKGVWSLRTHRLFKQIERAFFAACDRFGMRLIHFSVQGNHIHLIVEADDNVALARGMQGLGVRIAKGVNRAMNRHGKVLADRYHAHVLRTPTEVRNAVHYVLRNHLKHFDIAQIRIDEFSSESYAPGKAPTAAARYWLLRRLDAGA